LLSLTQYVDLCMPRGGEGLIRAVAECSKVPVIKHYKGVCHVYVDADADLKMAGEIVMNAKVQRPAVCNAMETLLVDKIRRQISARNREKLGRKKSNCAATLRQLAALSAENCKLETAKTACSRAGLVHRIQRLHPERPRRGRRASRPLTTSITTAPRIRTASSPATKKRARAKQFLAEVDSATVYWNASTRFTDGGEFGMGAEIGISTDKIGARGPMGLEELTTYKWLGIGNISKFIVRCHLFRSGQYRDGDKPSFPRDFRRRGRNVARI
jgi:glutamate-5-semialdehyde dehydrogenase